VRGLARDREPDLNATARPAWLVRRLPDWAWRQVRVHGFGHRAGDRLREFSLLARESIAVIQARRTDEKEAAATVGTNGWQTFRCQTFPNFR
jgi:hypothetical protein